MIEFNDERLERYSRNIVVPGVGIQGQRKLFGGRVLVIGAGGLGCPAALYLAAAGVGTIGIADGDKVEISNLQRQIAHTTRDIGRLKVESVAARIQALNPDVTVRLHGEFLSAPTILAVLAQYDFVIDGTDSFGAKFLVNDACVLARVPYSHGGVLRFEGEALTVLPQRSACYRCVFPAPPPAGTITTCAEAGVLGAVAGMLGAIQATEALKYLIGAGQVLADELLAFDAESMHFRKLKVRRREDCAVCGISPSITMPTDLGRIAGDSPMPDPTSSAARGLPASRLSLDPRLLPCANQ